MDPGRDETPAWLARAAISLSEPRFLSVDLGGDTVLGAALSGDVSGLGDEALWSDSWDILISPAETICA
jgi:hypothetical protein